MFRTLLIAGLALSTVAQAQSSTSLPTTVSPSCASYLSSLNTDTVLSSCIQPLLTAASAFSPTSTSNSSSSSSAGLSSTLSTLCSTPACSDTIVRTHLANFYSSCQAELTASNATSTPNGQAYAQVRQFYDVLYVVNPLRAAVCSKDNSTGAWCVQEIAHENLAGSGSNSSSQGGVANVAGTPSSSSSVNTAQNAAIALAQANLYLLSSNLRKRQSDNTNSTADSPLSTPAPLANDTTLLQPNSSTYGSTNLAFLFLLPSLPSTQLCTPCTRTLLTSYIKWESAVPYALGLANSEILGGQAALWNGVTGTCGQGFVGDVEQGAGTVLGGSLSAAFPRLDGHWTGGIMGLVAGLAALLAL